LVLLIKHYHFNKTKENEKGGACGVYVGRTRTYRMLTGASEGKGPNGRPRRRWQDNIKMDLQEIG
jgi:hypothetical protein